MRSLNNEIIKCASGLEAQLSKCTCAQAHAIHTGTIMKHFDYLLDKKSRCREVVLRAPEAHRIF